MMQAALPTHAPWQHGLRRLRLRVESDLSSPKLFGESMCHSNGTTRRVVYCIIISDRSLAHSAN